jgi:hypothetical protein
MGFDLRLQYRQAQIRVGLVSTQSVEVLPPAMVGEQPSAAPLGRNHGFAVRKS